MSCGSCARPGQLLGAVGMAMLFTAAAAVASPNDSLPRDLTDLSLEELMQVEVTTVSRKSKPLFEAPAAVYVITAEEIERSGATSIPEALRLVPGVQVASVNASQWAISARGFNNQFANKLLVLVDGRSVYTPLFAGVYWDVQNILLENIERIEVVRGPGATLWGANAVNGVINIITRPARDTTGWLASAGTGTEERGHAALRRGGAWGETHYRADLQWTDRDAFAEISPGDASLAGAAAADDWSLLRGGFRIDGRMGGRDTWHADVGLYDGDIGQTLTLNQPEPPYSRTEDTRTEVSGGNLLARWNHASSPRSDWTLQLYYDQTRRRDPFLGEDRRTGDVDFQHQLGLGNRHLLVWGAGYRVTSDDIDNTFMVTLDPARRTAELWSAFVQDELALPGKLTLTLGSKFEHNSYTGFEVQPGARLLWQPSPQHAVWGAIARAVRTPSRVEHDSRFVLGVFPGADSLLTHVALLGNPDLASDELLAYELGYRVRPAQGVFLDVAGFYNVYDELGTVEPGQAFDSSDPPPRHHLIPLRLQNFGWAETWGAELAAQWHVDVLRLAAAYSWLDIQLHREPFSRDASVAAGEGSDPAHQFNIRSWMDLPGRIRFDLALYWVDELPAQRIDAYTRLDARLAWKSRRHLELCVVGQNLLEERHTEFGSAVTSVRATEVERGVFGRATWRY